MILGRRCAMNKKINCSQCDAECLDEVDGDGGRLFCCSDCKARWESERKREKTEKRSDCLKIGKGDHV